MDTQKNLSNNVVGLKFLLRALSYRNYRLFFVGQSISLTGTWMQIIAIVWTVYHISGSVILLGIVSFASQIPTFILAPFAGALADKINRKKILFITQTLSMIQAFILAFLALSGAITVWHILILSVFLGLVNAFDIPARQAFLADMVEKKEDFVNAVALNSSMFNAARLIGPSVAGVLIGLVGEGTCFLLNGISFMAVIFALFAMRIKDHHKKEGRLRIFKDVKEGFLYVARHAVIRNILLFLSLLSLVSMSYPVLMPIFAKDIFKGGARELGFLMGSIGIGALLGTFYLCLRKNSDGLVNVTKISSFIFGFSLVMFSFSRNFWLSLFLLVWVGFGMIVQMASSNTLLQNLTDDDKRGRVMSFYAMSFMGMAPFSGLLAGFLASKIGAQHTIFFSGISSILSTVFFIRKLSFHKP